MDNTRITIASFKRCLFADRADLDRLCDKGRRRHRTLPIDFDFRANALSKEIDESWDEKVKRIHQQNREQMLGALGKEFGSDRLDEKLKNFIDIGEKRISILSYHNLFLEQVRVAFIVGAFYPALTAACSLGERILNHLIIDLRDEFKSSNSYKKVHRIESIDNWGRAIDILNEWGVLVPDVANEFRSLEKVRNRSIHFNIETYQTAREDALKAIRAIQEIISLQFGGFGPAPWFIEGVAGVAFIKKEYEQNPFVKKYFLPQCPFVGIYHGIEYTKKGRTRIIDEHDYGDGELTDKQFRDAYRKRDPNRVAKSTPR